MKGIYIMTSSNEMDTAKLFKISEALECGRPTTILGWLQNVANDVEQDVEGASFVFEAIATKAVAQGDPCDVLDALDYIIAEMDEDAPSVKTLAVLARKYIDQVAGPALLKSPEMTLERLRSCSANVSDVSEEFAIAVDAKIINILKEELLPQNPELTMSLFGPYVTDGGYYQQNSQKISDLSCAIADALFEQEPKKTLAFLQGVCATIHRAPEYRDIVKKVVQLTPDLSWASEATEEQKHEAKETLPLRALFGFLSGVLSDQDELIVSSRDLRTKMDPLFDLWFEVEPQPAFKAAADGYLGAQNANEATIYWDMVNRSLTKLEEGSDFKKALDCVLPALPDPDTQVGRAFLASVENYAEKDPDSVYLIAREKVPDQKGYWGQQLRIMLAPRVGDTISGSALIDIMKLCDEDVEPHGLELHAASALFDMMGDKENVKVIKKDFSLRALTKAYTRLAEAGRHPEGAEEVLNAQISEANAREALASETKLVEANACCLAAVAIVKHAPQPRRDQAEIAYSHLIDVLKKVNCLSKETWDGLFHARVVMHQGNPELARQMDHDLLLFVDNGVSREPKETIEVLSPLESLMEGANKTKCTMLLDKCDAALHGAESVAAPEERPSLPVTPTMSLTSFLQKHRKEVAPVVA